jgi:hypothetical protein
LFGCRGVDSCSASFESSIDYGVTKIPRFAFEKFPQTDPTLTTQMKSVSEAMAIGRSGPGGDGKEVCGDRDVLRPSQQSQVFTDRMVSRGEILHRSLQVRMSFQTRPGHDCFFA